MLIECRYHNGQVQRLFMLEGRYTCLTDWFFSLPSVICFAPRFFACLFSLSLSIETTRLACH